MNSGMSLKDSAAIQLHRNNLAVTRLLDWSVLYNIKHPYWVWLELAEDIGSVLLLNNTGVITIGTVFEKKKKISFKFLAQK